MKTYLCPECGRELRPRQKCPECGKRAAGISERDMLRSEPRGKNKLFKE